MAHTNPSIHVTGAADGKFGEAITRLLWLVWPGVAADQEQPRVGVEVTKKKLPYEVMTKIPVRRTYEVAPVLASGFELARQFFGRPARGRQSALRRLNALHNRPDLAEHALVIHHRLGPKIRRIEQQLFDCGHQKPLHNNHMLHVLRDRPTARLREVQKLCGRKPIQHSHNDVASVIEQLEYEFTFGWE